MKCINCGFESNDKFCPMCGTKLSQAFNTAPANNDSDGSAFAYPNGAETNPYQQAVPQQSAPYQQPNQGMPAPQQYSPYPYHEPQPKQSGNTLSIILSIIVCIVVVAGTVINIVSSALYKNSLTDLLTGMNDYYDSVYEEPYYEDYKTNEDKTIYSMNEDVSFEYGKIRFVKMEITKDNFEFDEDSRECALTFEIENTTDEYVELSVPSIQLCKKGGHYYEDAYEWLYDDFKSSNTDDFGVFSLDAGEKKSFVTYFKVPTDVNDFSMMLDLYDYDYIYNFVCYFEASLTQNDTQSASPQKNN